jgi:hypothetical protein
MVAQEGFAMSVEGMGCGNAAQTYQNTSGPAQAFEPTEPVAAVAPAAAETAQAAAAPANLNTQQQFTDSMHQLAIHKANARALEGMADMARIMEDNLRKLTKLP